MTGVHAIAATSTSAGTTIGTFDPISTRNGTIRLTQGTNGVVGIAYALARANQTTATAMMAILQIQSGDLGMSGPESSFALNTTTGGGIATQSNGYSSGPDWIPLDIGSGDGAAGGAAISLFLAQMGIEPADNFSIVASVAHTVNATPAAKWYDFAAVGGTLPAHRSVAPSATWSSGTTANSRDVGGAATLPTYLRSVVGIRNLQVQDGVNGTTEEAVAWLEYTSTIGGFTPNEWPTNAIGAALAGTLVGAGIAQDVPILPTWWPKGATVETLTPYANVLTAITAVNAFGYGALCRKDGGL